MIGRPPSAEDKIIFKGCRTVEDFIRRLTDSYIADVFIKGSSAGLGRLSEFYVVLRLEKEWEPRPGYDVWGAFEYDTLLKAGKVEVKSSTIANRSDWGPRISGYLTEFMADVVVFVCYLNTLNPCEARLFVIPRHALIETFNEQRSRGARRPQISIARSRINIQTGALNQWQEFRLYRHSSLKEQITKYIHGQYDFVVQQLDMFDL